MNGGDFKWALCIAVLVVNVIQNGCGQPVIPANINTKIPPSWNQSLPAKTITTNSKEDQALQHQVESKAYLSAMRPAVELGKAVASDQDMKEQLADAVAYFNSKPLAEIMSIGRNGEGADVVPVKTGSALIMCYRTSKPRAAGEVPVLAVGFGLGVNSIDSHGLLWYENGKWKAQPYPQADAQTTKQRRDILGQGPFVLGQFWELHQKGNLLVVLNDFYGTHPAEEVQLLQRENDVWKILWVPTYDQWQTLYDSHIEFHDGIDSFTADRQDIKKPDHKWQEVWHLQGTRYVMVSSTK